MCLSLPAQVIEVDEDRGARVRVGEAVRQADLSLVPDAQVGDWVMVYLGHAVARLQPEEAQELQDLLRQLGTQDGRRSPIKRNRRTR